MRARIDMATAAAAAVGFLLLVCMQPSVGDNSTDKWIADSLGIEQLMKETHEAAKLVAGKDIIILLGNSGTGKSTLSKYIRADPSLKVVESTSSSVSTLHSILDDWKEDEPSGKSQQRLVFTDGADKISSTDSLESKTLVPNVDVDPETGYIVVDFAWFSDTRGPKVDLAAAYFNKLLLDKSRKAKIILVENYSNLRLLGNRDSFTNSLKHFANLIGTNLDAVQQSVGLVATKIETKSLQFVVTEIQQFLSATAKHLKILKKSSEETDPVKAELTGRQIQLLGYMEDRFQLFLTPQSKEIGPKEKNRKVLRKFVFKKLNFSKPFAHKIRPVVMADTKIFIRDNLMNSIDHSFSRELRSIFDTLTARLETTSGVILKPAARMVRNTKQIYSEVLSLTKVDNLDDLLTLTKRKMDADDSKLADIYFQIDWANFLYYVIGDDFGKFGVAAMSGFKSSLKEYVTAEITFASFIQGLIDDLGTFEPRLSGLSKLKSEMKSITVENFKEVALNLRRWGFSTKAAQNAMSLTPTQRNIDWLHDILENELENELIVSTKGGRVTLYARYLILSHVRDMIENRNGTEGEFLLMAGETLFVDCDVIVQGANLKLLAPVVHVVKNNTVIHMRGEHALDRNDQANSCIRAEGGFPLYSGLKETKTQKTPAPTPGRPGIDGHSSGNLLILATEVLNGGWLSVKSEGGNGGKGQDGGNGCDTILFMDWAHKPYTDQLCGDLHRMDFKGKICVVDSIKPTNGAKGGRGGRGALSGKISILLEKNSTSNIQIETFKGKQGQPGNGGLAGIPNKSCTCNWLVPHNDAYIVAGILTIGIALPIMNNIAHNEMMSKMQDCCTDLVFAAEDIEFNNETWPEDWIFSRKYAEGTLLESVIEYSRIAMNRTIPLVADSGPGRLLNFYFSSEQFLSQFTHESYLKAIEVNGSLVGRKVPIQARIFYYSTILQSVRKWKKVTGKDVSEELELKLNSLLDTLQQFHRGKQVVHLADFVNTQLNRLKNANAALNEVRKFELVDAEKKSLMKTIEKAETRIQKVKKHNFDELKRKTETEINLILEKMESIDEFHNRQAVALEEHRTKLKSALWKDVGLGVLNMLGTLASAFYLPAVVIRPFIGIASKVWPQSNDEFHHQSLSEGIKQANLIFKKIEQQEMEQTKNVSYLASLIIDLDARDKFLSDKSRKLLKGNIESASDADKVFDDVAADLTSKIEELKATSSDAATAEKIRNYQSTRRFFQRSSIAWSILDEVQRLYERFDGSSSNIKVLDEAIESNRLDLDEIGKYKRSLHTTFKPIVTQMFEAFDSTALNLTRQDSLELIFEKFELQSYAKQYVSILHKLTQDFFSKDEGFSAIATDLQDLLDTLIDVYDQIEQLRFRIKLFEFMGKMAGVKCTTAQCNSLQKLSTHIKVHELIREFGLAYNAYRQVSFPFGAERASKINVTVEAFLSAKSENEVVALLTDALTQIKNELDFEAALTDKKDAVVIKAEFNLLKSSVPFYTWRHSEHLSKIRSLFQGKLITLDASAYAAGVKNAVKANWVALNITTEDEEVARQLKGLLEHFHLEMVRGKRSYFRCGPVVYAVMTEELTLTLSFETNRQGNHVALNAAAEKLSKGNVPLSPYTLWKFRLKNVSKEDPNKLFNQLLALANKVDLHLIGKGSYVTEDAEICNTALSDIYDFVGTD